MSVTPFVLCLNLAIRSVTLKPGNCPPSPGLAPCAILISNSEQLFKYSAAVSYTHLTLPTTPYV